MKEQRLFEVGPLLHLLGTMPNTISEELADTVCSHVASAKGLQRFTGVPVQLGRVWLDIIYPLGPPPEYERSGYVINLVGNQ